VPRATGCWGEKGPSFGERIGGSRKSVKGDQRQVSVPNRMDRNRGRESADQTWKIFRRLKNLKENGQWRLRSENRYRGIRTGLIEGKKRSEKRSGRRLTRSGQGEILSIQRTWAKPGKEGLSGKVSISPKMRQSDRSASTRGTSGGREPRAHIFLKGQASYREEG